MEFWEVEVNGFHVTWSSQKIKIKKWFVQYILKVKSPS